MQGLEWERSGGGRGRRGQARGHNGPLKGVGASCEHCAGSHSQAARRGAVWRQEAGAQGASRVTPFHLSTRRARSATPRSPEGQRTPRTPEGKLGAARGGHLQPKAERQSASSREFSLGAAVGGEGAGTGLSEAAPSWNLHCTEGFGLGFPPTRTHQPSPPPPPGVKASFLRLPEVGSGMCLCCQMPGEGPQSPSASRVSPFHQGTDRGSENRL